jgi:hypothetical protein
MQFVRQIEIDLGNDVTKPRALQPFHCLPFVNYKSTMDKDSILNLYRNLYSRFGVL